MVAAKLKIELISTEASLLWTAYILCLLEKNVPNVIFLTNDDRGLKIKLSDEYHQKQVKYNEYLNAMIPETPTKKTITFVTLHEHYIASSDALKKLILDKKITSQYTAASEAVVTKPKAVTKSTSNARQIVKVFDANYINYDDLYPLANALTEEVCIKLNLTDNDPLKKELLTTYKNYSFRLYGDPNIFDPKVIEERTKKLEDSKDLFMTTSNMAIGSNSNPMENIAGFLIAIDTQQYDNPAPHKILAFITAKMSDKLKPEYTFIKKITVEDAISACMFINGYRTRDAAPIDFKGVNIVRQVNINLNMVEALTHKIQDLEYDESAQPF